MRSPEQARFATAHHESAHAVAFYLHGHPVEAVKLITPAEAANAVEGERAGHVVPQAGDIENVCQAQEAIIEYLAGDAAVRIARAMNTLSDEEVGGVEVPDDKITLEDVMVSPNGVGARSAAYRGWADYSTHPDETNAERLAAEFSGDALEAEALMHYLKLRTSALVQSARFQHLMLTLADALLEQNEISGELANELLERADHLLTINSDERSN